MKKYVILLLIVLLGLAWISAGSDMVNNPIKAKEHIEKAEELEEKGIYVDAVTEYESALEYEPDNEELYMKLAEANLKSGDSWEFISICEDMAEQYQENTKAMDTLMNYYVENHDEEKAVKYLNDFLKEYPDNKNAREWFTQLEGSYEELNCRYEELSEIVHDSMVVSDEGVYGLADALGSEIISCKYRELYPFSEEGFALALTEDGRWVYIDEEDQIRKAPDEDYENLGMYTEDGTVAQKDGKYGYLDDDMEPVGEFQWENLTGIKNGIGAGKKNGKWTLISNVSAFTAKNKFVSDVYTFIKNEFKDIKVIQFPELLVNDLLFNLPGEYKLAEVYYKFFVEEIVSFINSNNVENNITIEIEKFIREKTAFELAKLAKVNGVDKGKKLVLVGESKSLEDVLKVQYNCEVSIRINYTKDTTDDEFYCSTDIIHGKSSDYYIIIPCLYRGLSTLRILMKRKYAPNALIISWLHPVFQLKNIYGKYLDIYNNEIISDRRDNIISFFGQGISVFLGAPKKVSEGIPHLICYDQSKIVLEDNISISGNCIFTAYWTSYIMICRDTSFADGTEIRAHSCGEVHIGSDCMFANSVRILCGDGHAIYDLHTGKNINSDPNINENDLKVYLGGHVWIGRESFLLNCKIGDGSIVGARAFVKKSFPNNCIVAGVPAKVIRKDIAWSREINCYDIDDPVFGVPEKYRKFTQDI